MNKVFITGFLCWGFYIPFTFSQDADHVNGGFSKKTIEYISIHEYLGSKGSIEKLFFGNSNAPVEFYFFPSSEAVFHEPQNPTSGFRIIKNTSDTYILEIKRILNEREASNEAKKAVSKVQLRELIDIPANLLDSLPREVFNLIFEHNTNISNYNSNVSNSSSSYKRQLEEELKLYKTETMSFPISDLFAENFYGKMVSFIGNFKAKREFQIDDDGMMTSFIITDGISVKCRTAVDNEIWTLDIHEPRGGNAVKMSNLCRQIITDAISNEFDEAKYMVVLSSFEVDEDFTKIHQKANKR